MPTSLSLWINAGSRTAWIPFPGGTVASTAFKEADGHAVATAPHEVAELIACQDVAGGKWRRGAVAGVVRGLPSPVTPVPKQRASTRRWSILRSGRETFPLTCALPTFFDMEASMRHRTLVTAVPFVLLLSTAAYAQAPAAAPPSSTSGASGVAAPQPGSTGAPATATGTPTGQPADTITNNSAAGGNAGQPERPLPQGGSGGK